MCSVAAAAPALSPGQTVPGPPGRPVAVGRCLVEAGRADRLADELGDVDAVVADDRRVRARVGALHVVFADCRALNASGGGNFLVAPLRLPVSVV